MIFIFIGLQACFVLMLSQGPVWRRGLATKLLFDLVVIYICFAFPDVDTQVQSEMSLGLSIIVIVGTLLTSATVAHVRAGSEPRGKIEALGPKEQL